MIACARNDLNLPASNYAVIFPNQSSFTGAKRRYPAWLSVRSCAPKNARIAMSRVQKVYEVQCRWVTLRFRCSAADRNAVSPLKLRLRWRNHCWTLWIGLKELRTGLGDWFSSKDAFQRRFGAVERAGTLEKEERRGAWLIFYLRGDLASRARIPTFIDPYNHSPL